MKNKIIETYFSQLLYWSSESIKKGLTFMPAVGLTIETLELLNNTTELVEYELHNVTLYKELNIIDNINYTKLLEQLTMIHLYLIKRKMERLK